MQNRNVRNIVCLFTCLSNRILGASTDKFVRGGLLMATARDKITAMYTAAINAVNPAAAVRDHLDVRGGLLIARTVEGIREYRLDAYKNIIVTGFGKAAAPMAKAVEELFGTRIGAGCVVVKYGYTEKLDRIDIMEAAHPVPDESGRAAAARIRGMLRAAGKDDLVIVLVSGGGSALLPLPPETITLDEKRATTDLLLKSGASIHEINAVRKHMSLVKGGNLAKAAYPATVLCCVMSDVVGDDLDVISSGPLYPDASTFRDALRVLENYDLVRRAPASVIAYITAGVDGVIEENPKRDSGCFERVAHAVVASNIIALRAAETEAKRLGYATLVLSSRIEGDTRECAMFHAAIAREILNSGVPLTAPACVISGGETTVRVTGAGLGGRNMEFALQSAVFIEGCEGVTVASVGSDGSDGPTDAAGAFADGGTAARARAAGQDIFNYMRNSDSYNFFSTQGGLIVTGPTNTNVMDIRIVVVDK